MPVSGSALQGSDTATSIRGDVITDGPFVETKEALGGYYLIDAEDLHLLQECAQDAYLSALETWQRDGIPRNPVPGSPKPLDARRWTPTAAHPPRAPSSRC